ncbi:hypothetical protein DID80_05470, partial [Candidatus Marinamargulisbacteria bacterium SCGC AAA071-K20]
MGLNQPKEFTGMAKPERFPFFNKPLPNKNFKMFANEQQQELYQSKKFTEILNKNLDSSAPTTLTKGQKMQVSINQMTMMMTSIQQGFDSLPLHLLAMMELENSINNFEKVKDKNFANYASALQGSLVQAQSKLDETKRKKASGIEDEDEEDIDGESPLVAEGSTYLHNANLYKGLSTDNPFKEQDETHEVYEDNPIFAMQKDEFMNTQSVRGKEVKERVDKITQKHQDSMPALEGVTDPYTDTKVEEFEIRGNYHTLLTNPALRESWKDEDYHAHLLGRWSDRKNVSKVVRSVGGKAYSQFESISKLQKVQKIESNQDE